MYRFFFKRIVFSSVIIILISIIAFWGITDIFFQQDEWLGLGGALYRQEMFGTIGSIAEIFNFSNRNEFTRFLPLSSIISYFMYTTVGLNFPVYGILGFILLASCAIVLIFITYKLTQSYALSILVSLMWATNNLAYQAYTWIGTMVTSLFSVLLFMISFYALLMFRESKKKFVLVISILAMILSLLCKESGIFYYVVYVLIIWIFFAKSFNLLERVKLTSLYLIPAIISIFLPRLIYLLNNQTNFSSPINSTSQSDLIYNIFLLPAKSLYHVFLPSSLIHEHVYSISRTIFQNYTDGFIISRIVGDAFSLLVAFYILLVVALALAFAKSDIKKLILFSLFSFFASFAPFIVFKNSDVILEPRYYVFPAIFSSLLTAGVVYTFASRIKNAGNFLTVLIITPILLFNIQGVREMLKIDIVVGNHRREMLNTVSEIRPNLAKDNVFYFFTGHTGFWEFQSGFGQTLAVWLYDTGKIPKEALIDRDFWDLSYEGIKQYPSGKYGYFMTYDKLLNGLKENKDISLDQVHAYYWDYQKYTVKNVSEEIRPKLKKDLEK